MQVRKDVPCGHSGLNEMGGRGERGRGEGRGEGKGEERGRKRRGKSRGEGRGEREREEEGERSMRQVKFPSHEAAVYASTFS